MTKYLSVDLIFFILHIAYQFSRNREYLFTLKIKSFFQKLFLYRMGFDGRRRSNLSWNNRRNRRKIGAQCRVRSSPFTD